MRASPAAQRGRSDRRPAASRHAEPGRFAWPAHPPDPLAAAIRGPRSATATPRAARERDEELARADWPRTPRRATAWQRWRAVILPMLTLIAVMGVELSTRQWTYIGYTVLVPMVAANLTGPRMTSVFAGLAFAAGVFSVWWEHLWGEGQGGAPALIARLVGIALGGAMAILASRYTAGRETKLANITQVAEAAQRTILSDMPATSRAGLRLAVRYESAASEAMVGGDLYEMVDSPFGTRLLLGDARGKGLDAVRLASRVLGCFRVVGRRRPDVVDIVADLDGEVRSAAGLDDFVTGVVAEFSPGCLTLLNAGHPDPVLWRDGTAHLLAPPERQPPLGLGAGDAGGLTVGLRPGDRLLLYTDGIAEARDRSGAFFPLLAGAGQALGRAGSLDHALGCLVESVQDWTGRGLQDDMALLAVEVPAERALPAAAGGEGRHRRRGHARGATRLGGRQRGRDSRGLPAGRAPAA